MSEEHFVKQGLNRSFGRMASRMSVETQQKLAARLAPYHIDLPAQEARLDIKSINSEDKPLFVEIGMGNGEHIFHRAKTHCDWHHIGVEVYKNGLRSLVINLEKHGLKNLNICSVDAREVLSALPKNSVDELAVLYPDPWPKTKHHKRRIINQDFLREAGRAIKPNGKLFCVTDIHDYAFWMLREILSCGHFTPTATKPEDWATPPENWPPDGTKYERKAKKAGRTPWYFVFERNLSKVI